MDLKKWYFNLSIRNKILLFFYSIVIIVAALLGLYSYTMSESNVVQKVSTANLGIIKQVINNVNVLKNDIDDISTYLCIDQTVQDYLTGSPENASDVLVSRENSMKFIMNLVVSKSYITLVSIYGDNGLKPYYIVTDASSGLNEDLDSIKQTDIYKRAAALKGAPLWFPMGAGNFLLKNNNYPKIAMCRVIRDANTARNIGLLLMCMNQTSVEALCSSNIQTGREGMVIVDRDGKTIAKAGVDFYGKRDANQAFIRESLKKQEGFLEDSVEKNRYLISYSYFPGMDWRIYYAVPEESLTKQINYFKIFTLVVILACLLLSFPLMLIISSFLTAPITKLLHSMKSFQTGNFDERVEFKYRDEIGELGSGYNDMVKNIKELIEKAYVLQIKEREAELSALQAQINPHFLYNTLDTIYWKSQSRGEKDISEMVFSLSRLFRLSLNRGRESTLVANEKELVEHYLMLQKIRFKEKLNYTIDMEEGILGFVIPKLILQPFVENAILHGLEAKEKGGSVAITGRLEEGRLKFDIEDDGVGMSADALQTLLSKKEDGNEYASSISGGYAVKNVNDRLKLYFRDNYSLKFQSEAGRGTRVEMVIPAVQADMMTGGANA